MIRRQRSVGIRAAPADIADGLEHLRPDWLAILRWLADNRVDYVLVGPVARAIRGDHEADGPVTIVPAPYARNLERLSRALWAAHARLRLSQPDGSENTVPIKLTVERLSEGERWLLRCGERAIEIESHPAGVPGYQELVYEAERLAVADEVAVEVAGAEGLERYAQLRHAHAHAGDGGAQTHPHL